MKFDVQCEAQHLRIRLFGDRRRHLVYQVCFSLALVVALHFLIYRDGLRVIAESVGGSWLVVTALRHQFGVCELSTSETQLILKRHTFGIGKTSAFPRNDVERFGFEPADQYDDSALALMVRTKVMPMRFAHGITPDEAKEVFSRVEKSGLWLGRFIRPVGAPMF